MNQPIDINLTVKPRRLRNAHEAVACDKAAPGSTQRDGTAGAQLHPAAGRRESEHRVLVSKLDTTLRELKDRIEPIELILVEPLGSRAYRQAHLLTESNTALFRAQCTSEVHPDLTCCVVKLTSDAELARNEWDHLTNMRSSVLPTPFFLGFLAQEDGSNEHDRETRFAIVMEFIRGETLDALIERGFGPDHGSAPVEKALEIISPLASAFRDLALSLHPFVHRDVKPANIMVEHRGTQHRTRLIDLGVSSSMGDPRQHEHLGCSAGFAAPELAMPESYPLGELFSIDDARIDTYGLAATLHTLLVGSPPYDPNVTAGGLSSCRIDPRQLRHDAATLAAIKTRARDAIYSKHHIEADDATLDALLARAIAAFDEQLVHTVERGLDPLQSMRPTPNEFFDMLPANYQSSLANEMHLLFLEHLASGGNAKADSPHAVQLADAEAVDLRDTSLDDAYRYPSFAQDFHQAMELYNSGRYYEAVPLLEKLDKAGDATSSYNLGVCYKDGLGGLEPNPFKMLACWTRAAAVGHIVAIFNVGMCHENGIGVPKTPETAAAARIWYQRAADLGFPAARERLFNLE